MDVPYLSRITDYLDLYAEKTPAAPFLHHDGDVISYADALDWVDRFSRALLSVGVVRGDRVAAYGEARPEFYLSFLATARIGAVWLGLNPKYTEVELNYNVSDAVPKVVFGLRDDVRQGSVLADFASAVGCHVVTRERSDVGESLDQFLARAADTSAEVLAEAMGGVGPEDAAAVVYTSGTTGRPKGALLPHRGFVSCYTVQTERFVTFEPLRTLCDLPINHIGCLGDLCSSTMVAGGCIVFVDKFSPAAALNAIEKETITFWGAVPTMYQMAIAAPEWSTADLSSLRRVFWSGGAASPALVESLKVLGVPLSTSYGMTETTGSVTFTTDEDTADVLANTVGKTDPAFRTRVLHGSGRDCAVDEEGELLVSGPCVMLGYLHRPDATAEALQDGWLRTGDLARVRDDGNLVLVGRLSDMFKSGGYNVYCREVELALEEYPGVDVAAVLPVRDELYGQVGHAYVQATFDIAPDDIAAHLRTSLAGYKVPKKIMVMRDLPKLPVGKVDKARLRDSQGVL